MTDYEPLVTIAEASKILGWAASTLRRECARGTIPRHQLPGVRGWRVRISEIEEVTRGGVRVDAVAPSGAGGAEVRPPEVDRGREDQEPSYRVRHRGRGRGAEGRAGGGAPLTEGQSTIMRLAYGR